DARGDWGRHVFGGLAFLFGFFDLFLVLGKGFLVALVLGIFVGFLFFFLPVKGPLEATLGVHLSCLFPVLLGPVCVVQLQCLPRLAQLGVVSWVARFVEGGAGDDVAGYMIRVAVRAVLVVGYQNLRPVAAHKG